MIRGEVCLLYDRVDGLGMVTDGQREACRSQGGPPCGDVILTIIFDTTTPVLGSLRTWDLFKEGDRLVVFSGTSPVRWLGR